MLEILSTRMYFRIYKLKLRVSTLFPSCYVHSKYYKIQIRK